MIIKVVNRFLLALLASYFLSGCESTRSELSTAQKSAIKSEVKAAFEGLVKAANALDTEQYFFFFDEKKFVGLNGDGTIWQSLDDLKSVIEPGFGALQKVQSLDFTKVKLSVIDANNVILVNEYEQQIELKSGQTLMLAGGGTQVWSKSAGAWKLVSVSASNKPVRGTKPTE